MKIYIKIVLMFITAALLTSCVAVKTYEKPEVEPDGILSLDLNEQDTTNYSEIKWKNFFSDPILINYIDSALVNNYDNKIAYENIVAADAQYTQGKLSVLPSLSIGGEVQRNEVNKTISEQYSLSGTLAWELNIWGKLTSGKRASEARFLNSVIAQKMMQTTIISNVANTYYQIMQADENIKILERAVHLNEESLETTRLLKNAGLVNELIVNQTASRLEENKATLHEFRNRLHVLENAFRILLAKPVEEIKRSTLNVQTIPSIFTDGFSTQNLSNRPDVKIAELQFRSAFEELNVATASLYPSIRLSATAGFRSMDVDEWFESNSFFSSLIGGITQPIFARGELKTREKVAEAQMKQSLYGFKKKLLEASADISDVMNSYNMHTEKLTNRSIQEKELKKALENTIALQESGYTNYLDVLTAEANLLNARLARVSEQSLKTQMTTLLYKALGGGVN